MDMKVSADTQEGFRNAMGGSSKVDSIELSVHVLTTGFWPTQTGGKCNLPPQILRCAMTHPNRALSFYHGHPTAHCPRRHDSALLHGGPRMPSPHALVASTCRVRCCDVFKEHYLKQHSGRRLQWQANMGNADLKAVFQSRKYEINVSTYLMCVLLLFNASESLTYSEIAEATEIPPADLQRALQSLACAKFKILNKEPKGREVKEGGTLTAASSYFLLCTPTPTGLLCSVVVCARVAVLTRRALGLVCVADAFSFNGDFSAKHLRFKVGTVNAAKETEVEKQETRQKVDEDRKPQIEAAIVRVMKSRKEMEHNALIAEVTSQLTSRFLPHPNVIKKRIESLIEREFLERDKDNWRKYKYLA